MKRPAASRRGRRGAWKAAFFVGAVAAIVIGVAWALIGPSLLVVRTVHVLGAGHQMRRRVLAAAGITLGTPLIRVDTSVVAERVDQITAVQSASVRRSWPDAVVISVVPRTAVFSVRSGRGYDVVDRYGVILRHAPRPAEGLVPLLAAGRPAALRGSKAVLAAGAVLRGLPSWLRHEVTAVRAAGRDRVILLLRHGVTVIWGGAGRPAAKAREVLVLLGTGATYCDVSDPVTATTGWPGGA